MYYIEHINTVYEKELQAHLEYLKNEIRRQPAIKKTNFFTGNIYYHYTFLRFMEDISDSIQQQCIDGELSQFDGIKKITYSFSEYFIKVKVYVD